jgi:hypothetical protein
MSESTTTPEPSSETTIDFTPPMSQQEFFASLENFDAITDLPTWQGQDKLANLGPAPVVSPEAIADKLWRDRNNQRLHRQS